MDIITSSQNARLKRVRTLLSYGKRRRSEQALVLEGVRLVQDALAAGAVAEFVLLREDMVSPDLVDQLRQLDVTTQFVATALFDQLSDTQTSQGVLGVFPWPDVPAPESPNMTLILDQFADPGNVGTALRTAVAAGVDLVVLAPNTVDPYNPKVVRAAMGAHFRIPIVRWDWPQIDALDIPLVVADAHGDTTIYDLEWPRPCGLVIGSEAHGPSHSASQRAAMTVRIPMAAGESLNAAMSAGIILFEVFRRWNVQP